MKKILHKFGLLAVLVLAVLALLVAVGCNTRFISNGQTIQLTQLRK